MTSISNNNPDRFIFDRKYFKSNTFRWGLRRLISRDLNIKMKDAQNIVFHLRPLDDEECISYIRSYIDENDNSNFDGGNVSLHRAMEKLGLKNIEKAKRYLDIGCNNGKMTLKISKELNIDDDNTYGVDIKIYNNPLISNIGIYDGCHLPFQPKSLDYITVFQTLHHINPVYLSTLLNEINRVLKKGGKVLIKEHNADSEEIIKLVELEHLIFNIKNSESYDYLKARSETEWDNLFKEYGLKKLNNFSYSNDPNDPTKNYYSLYHIE